MTPSTVLATLATARLAGTNRDGLLCVLQGCLQAASKARLDAARYVRTKKPPRSIRRAVHYLREAGLDDMAEDVLRYWSEDTSWPASGPDPKGRKKWVESGKRPKYQVSKPFTTRGKKDQTAGVAGAAPKPAAGKPARVTPEQANARIAEMLAAGRVSPQDAQELTGYLMGLTAEQQRELNRHYKARAGSGPKPEMARKLAERILAGGAKAQEEQESPPEDETFADRVAAGVVSGSLSPEYAAHRVGSLEGMTPDQTLHYFQRLAAGHSPDEAKGFALSEGGGESPAPATKPETQQAAAPATFASPRDHALSLLHASDKITSGDTEYAWNLTKGIPADQRKAFDAAILDLARDDHLVILKQDHPGILTPEERASLIHDPKNDTYFMGVAARGKLPPATPSPDVQGEQASASGPAGLEALAADISRLPGLTAADARTIADPQRPLADKLKSIAGADVAAFDPLKRASNAKELLAISDIGFNEYLRGLALFHNSYSGDPGNASNPLGVNRRAQETLDRIDSMGAMIRDRVVPGLRKLAAAGVTEIDGEPYGANAFADFYEQHAQTVIDEVKKDVVARRDSLLGKTAEAPKGLTGNDAQQDQELMPEEKSGGSGDPYKDAFSGSGDVEAAIAHINTLPLAKLKALAKQHGIYGAKTEKALRSELEQELRYKRGVWKDDDAEEEEESPDVPAAPKEAPKPSKPPKDMSSDEAGEWAAASLPGKRGGPDSPLRTALKQTFEDLSMLVEYKHDRLVDLPALFNRAKAKVPNLTPEEFKQEVKSWWGDRSGKGHEGRAEMHIQNEVHKLRPDQRAMAIDDMPGSGGASFYYLYLP